MTSTSIFSVKKHGLITLVAVTLAGGWWAGRASANGLPSPMPMRFAGTLAEQGVPVNGTRDVTIVLYDSGTPNAGNILCSTAAGATAVTQGHFSVSLVDKCTDQIASKTDVWTEVQVGGVSFGRQKINAVPYAVMAGAVNGVVTSSAILPSAQADGSLARGDGNASIYNDGTQGALVVTGNGAAGSGKVILNDNATVSHNLAVVGNGAYGGVLAANGGLQLAASDGRGLMGGSLLFKHIYRCAALNAGTTSPNGNNFHTWTAAECGGVLPASSCIAWIQKFAQTDGDFVNDYVQVPDEGTPGIYWWNWDPQPTPDMVAIYLCSQ